MYLTTRIARVNCLVLLYLALATVSASAEIIDLAPPPETYLGQEWPGVWEDGAGAGSGRSFIFEDVASFRLASVGIEINASPTMVATASLYSVTGEKTLGTLLATNSTLLSDVGRAFYDIPLSYLFAGTNNRFALDIQWNAHPDEVRYYSFDGQDGGPDGIDPYYVRGPVRVIDGKADHFENNYIIAHFRFGTVPEPASAGLLMLGSIALVATTRRRFGGKRT
jgi:PEP-CTERM motif